ncbi:hypothetical protein FBU59_003044, partial [Linderina macrospora]
MDNQDPSQALSKLLDELQNMPQQSELITMHHITRLEEQLQGVKDETVQKVDSMSGRVDELRALFEEKSQSIQVTCDGFQILANRAQDHTSSIDQLTETQGTLSRVATELQRHIGLVTAGLEGIRQEIRQTAQDCAELKQGIQEMRGAQK